MKKVLVFIFLALTAAGAWAADDPTTPPCETMEEAGLVATNAIYPFITLPVSPGTRHATVGALPNGNFVIITTGAGTNLAAVVLGPQGNIVAGPSPVVHDANGPIGFQDATFNCDVGDPWLGLSRDGSEVAIVFETEGAETKKFTNVLYPDDPGSVYLQRLRTSDLSPVGEAVSVFPGSVTAPTPDQTNFGYFPASYMPNGSVIILARSNNQWDLALRDDAKGRIQSGRLAIMTIINSNATQVVVPPRIVGREYGYDLLANPNQWNAEPGRGTVPYADGCVIYLDGAHGWATVDQNGNVGQWREFKCIQANGTEWTDWGDGNQGALLTDGKYRTGRTSANPDPASVFVYDIPSGQRIFSTPVTIWELHPTGQRSFGGMNPKGETFMIWHEPGYLGINTAAGRFVSADGVPYGKSCFIVMESGTDAGGGVQHERGQCAFGNSGAIFISHDAARPGRAPGAEGTEVVARIFQNPFGTPVTSWELH